MKVKAEALPQKATQEQNVSHIGASGFILVTVTTVTILPLEGPMWAGLAFVLCLWLL